MPFIAMPAGPELLIILVVIVFFFGASKLPDLARGSGQAIRIFRSETRGDRAGTTDAEASPAHSDEGSRSAGSGSQR